jgi:phenylpropionate dioxygenase-like ring-hydroxylating dioxygenase large terminal subunit
VQFADLLRAYPKEQLLPAYLFIDKSEWFGDEDIDVDRYISRECHELEKERIWKKVWQLACREEEIPEVGDCITYEITDISILLVRTTPTDIKGYFNVCLHQGRLLMGTGQGSMAAEPSRREELRCPFHGFCWRLDGSLKHIPSKWDFPHVDPAKFALREVKVGRWGGFVFINMDSECESLESYMGDMPMHWEKFPLEDRYIAAHTAKIFPANWKTTQDAFMEAFHAQMTHPQFSLYTNAASDNEQLDAFANYSRGLGVGLPMIGLAVKPTPAERLAGYIAVGHPEIHARVRGAGPIPELEKQFQQHARIRREALRDVVGNQVDELSDVEANGGGYFTLFPNFHPWWAYDEICYRFRPYKDEHEFCVMETYLLRPFKGERPKPAPIHWLGLDDSHLDAPELGLVAQIFHQDEFNVPAVQKGLHNLKALGKGLTLGTYQATKIRHFHRLWTRWVNG